MSNRDEIQTNLLGQRAKINQDNGPFVKGTRMHNRADATGEVATVRLLDGSLVFGVLWPDGQVEEYPAYLLTLGDVRQVNLSEIEWDMEVDQDDVAIEGNVMVSGDAEADAEAEAWVRGELSEGNVWAWASVLVTAKWNGHRGYASLGGVSTQGRDAFFADGDAEALVSEALDAMLAEAEKDRVTVGDNARQTAVNMGVAALRYARHSDPRVA